MPELDIYSGLRPGDEVVHERISYFFTTRTPDDRLMFISSLGVVLTMPDPVTGIPAFPTAGMLREAQRRHLLFLRSPPLPDPVRADARAEEPTLDEVDHEPWAALRRMVVRAFDREPADGKPMKSNEGLQRWIREHFGETELIAQYGRVPVGSTIREWLNARGRPGDRRGADMTSRSGKVPRKRRFPQVVIALGELHAAARSAKAGRRDKVQYKMFKRDIRRINKGEPVSVNGVDFVYDAPASPLKPYCEETFRLECRKAGNADALDARFGRKARQALYGGGGVAKEPTRFLEIVEQDDTPFPKYFVIDPYNRVPCGTPTAAFSFDVFTHAFVGWDVSFDSPSLSTWMRAVLHGAEPKEVPKRFQQRYPGLADICGYVTGCYLYDNALQNVSRAVEDAGGDLCHEVRLAGEGEATHKTHVERGHQTVTSFMAEIPGSSFDIPLMRKFGYDPEKHVVVTIEEFRVLLAEAIATYHVTECAALNGRTPLDVWEEQVGIHGLRLARDTDQFTRSIGNVHLLTFTKTGVDLNHLDYSAGRLNEELLADMAAAHGSPKKTVNPSFIVKVKSYDDDVGFISVFNPLTRRYVHVPCTKPNYASGTPLWLHKRVREHAAQMGLAFSTEEEMDEARIGLSEVIAAISPDAEARQRRELARLLDRPAARRRLGENLRFIRVPPSATGMDKVVEHDLRIETRRDHMIQSPRPKRGRDHLQRDRRDAPMPIEAPEEESAGAGQRQRSSPSRPRARKATKTEAQTGIRLSARPFS